MPGSYLHGSWEISSVPDGILSGGTEKGNRNSAIYAVEKSDTPIVSKKPANNDRPAEVVEKRGVAKGNAEEPPAGRTQSRVTASMGLEGIREVVRRGLTMLCYVINPRQEPCAVVPLAGICAGGVGQPAFLPRPSRQAATTAFS